MSTSKLDGFNTDDGIRRAAICRERRNRFCRLHVSIPMTVLGGLQFIESFHTKLQSIGVSIPMTVLGGLQSYEELA